MDREREGRRPVVGDDSKAPAEAMEDDGSSSPAVAKAMEYDDSSSSPAPAEVGVDDDCSSSPSSYIRLVQHLIEKCICYNMNREECVVTLEKHANIQPVITSTVWKELEKENREFFETYKKDRPGEEESTTQKNPSDEQPASNPKSSEDDDEDDDDQPSAPNKSSDDDEKPSLPKAQPTTTITSSPPLPRAQKKTTTPTRNYGARHEWYYGTYI